MFCLVHPSTLGLKSVFDAQAVDWKAVMTPLTIKMKVNESLTFKWGDALVHDLNLLTGKAAYEACDTMGGVKKALIENGSNTSYTIGPLTKGHFYYACGVRGQCQAGQKVAVVVTA